eukprot:scaffold319854_cov19-Tisochrysis_lutea.AAC.1
MVLLGARTGSLHRFKVISYRQDMVFALVRGGLAAPSIGAITPVIHIANPNEPLQVHLALTNEVR